MSKEACGKWETARAINLMVPCHARVLLADPTGFGLSAATRRDSLSSAISADSAYWPSCCRCNRWRHHHRVDHLDHHAAHLGSPNGAEAICNRWIAPLRSPAITSGTLGWTTQADSSPSYG